MPSPEITTVRDQIAWAYANLARAHNALTDNRTKYITLDHMIRARLNKGLRQGTMSMRSIFDDEKLKHGTEWKCSYCGSRQNLSLDHLFPQSLGGRDDGANLVPACRLCNSSKGKKDLLEWYARKDEFPPLMLLRRYMKIVSNFCEQNDLMDRDLTEVPQGLPFDLRRLPTTNYPPLSELKL